MSRIPLKDMAAILERATFTDDYGVDGSTFRVCRICDAQNGPGIFYKSDWHASDCPVPRLQRKYAHRGAGKKGGVG